MKCNMILTVLTWIVACSSTQAITLMDTATNNGSFNNPAPTGYTIWNTATQQSGWTASPFNASDGNRQWSDTNNTPNILPSGNPTVSGPGNAIAGYPSGSSFTSNPIGTLGNNTNYDISGWGGYAYGNSGTARRIELLATDGVNETSLARLDWPGNNLGSFTGAFTQRSDRYWSGAADPLAGQDLIVRATLLTGAFASFGDISVKANPALPRTILMNATTNNGSFNNPAPVGYTAWNTPTQQAGWTTSPFNINDGDRQWSDTNNTPNVLPSGRPTVSGAGNGIAGYPNGSSFTSNPIGTVASNSEYDLSGWTGYAYGPFGSPTTLQLIATDGVNETPLVQLNWPGDPSYTMFGTFTKLFGTYTTAASDPLAGQNLIVRATVPTGAFASFGDFVVGVTALAGALNGDYNHNGVVDAADYVLWRKDPASYGGSTTGYTVWRSNFGNPTGSGVSLAAAVPEPCGVVLLGLGSLALVLRRARAIESR